jgi:hypothetical protein
MDFFRMRLRYSRRRRRGRIISGLVVTTGPLNTPRSSAYGLRRGAYVGTETVYPGSDLSRGAAFRPQL